MTVPTSVVLRVDLTSWPTWLAPVAAHLQSGRDGSVDGTRHGEGMRFEVTVGVKPGKDGRPDFTGPLVHGRPGERFLYVAWTVQHGSHTVRFRRLKLYLGPLERAHWTQPGVGWDDLASGRLAVAVPGTLEDGSPNCGTARAPWALA